MDTGDVEVAGPSVFAGYWRRPDLHDDTFTRRRLVSHRRCRPARRGRLPHLVGRSKDLIISGGLNVYPKEVEDAIDALAGVDESAVVGVPDPDFGEAVVAVVVAEPGATRRRSADPADVRARLAAFKVPKRVVLVAALPRNVMGKVEKHRLRARARSGRHRLTTRRRRAPTQHPTAWPDAVRAAVGWLTMSRRIDVELTSSREDGSWTWRRREPSSPRASSTVHSSPPARRSATCCEPTSRPTSTARRSWRCCRRRRRRSTPIASRSSPRVPRRPAGHHARSSARAGRRPP